MSVWDCSPQRYCRIDMPTAIFPRHLPTWYVSLPQTINEPCHCCLCPSAWGFFLSLWRSAVRAVRRRILSSQQGSCLPINTLWFTGLHPHLCYPLPTYVHSSVLSDFLFDQNYSWTWWKWVFFLMHYSANFLVYSQRVRAVILYLDREQQSETLSLWNGRTPLYVYASFIVSTGIKGATI